MIQIFSVFKIQTKLFLKDKGMIVFYLISILFVGGFLPLILKSNDQVFSFSILLTFSFVKPILTDSLANEREKKTLESLFSTKIKSTNIIIGKAIFSLLFSFIYFMVCIGLCIFVNIILGNKLNVSHSKFGIILVLFLSFFCTISLIGVFISAKSDNSHIANSRISKFSYPLIFLLIIYFSILAVTPKLYALVIGAILFFINILIFIIFIIKILYLNTYDYFENINLKSNNNKNNTLDILAPKTQFKIILNHEFKYFLKYKSLLINFIILCFCPAIIVFILWFYTKEINIYYGVFLIALIMPRTPTNLVAISIGGEKSFKTGESLLSTPLKVSSIFLGKSMVSIIISGIMLIISSLFTLIFANIISYFTHSGKIYLLTLDQFVLIFLAGILSCISMVFITGILSMIAKTPRSALYISSVLGIIFAFPPIIIVYGTTNPLIWSLLYSLALLIFNVICIIRISNNISRPILMKKL